MRISRREADLMLPAGWPVYVSAELCSGPRTGPGPRFTSLEVAIKNWRLLDADLQFMAVIMVDPPVPASGGGELTIKLDWTDIPRVADMLRL